VRGLIADKAAYRASHRGHCHDMHDVVGCYVNRDRLLTVRNMRV